MYYGWISRQQYRKKQYGPKANRNSHGLCKVCRDGTGCRNAVTLRHCVGGLTSVFSRKLNTTRWTIRDSNLGMGKGAFYKTSRPTMRPYLFNGYR